MKKKFKMPHAFVIIIAILVLVSLMTYVIPGGEYDRYKNDEGTTVVDPQSFHYVESSPVGPWEIPTYIVKALIQQVDIIVALLVISGGIEVVIQTNVFHAFCGKLAQACSGKQKFFIPVLLLLFSFIGITQAPNKFVGFAPIGVMLAISLGYDAVVGIAITLIGIAIGFSAGTFGPTTAVAQTIAELPAYSGASMRVVAHVVLLVVSAIYIVGYAEKVRKDPTKSVVYGDSNVMKFDIVSNTFEIEKRHWPVMAAFVAGIVVMIFGCIKYGWSLSTTSIVFIWLALVAGLIYGYTPSQICEYFVKGSKNMVNSALLVGIGAAGITYDKWMKFMGKLFLIWVLISVVLMMVCQVIGYA